MIEIPADSRSVLSPALSVPVRAGSHWPPPWLFAVLPLACGIYTGYCQTPLPWLLRRMGYSVDRIGSIESFILIPISLYFIATPLVDFGLRRRTWSVVLSVLSGLLLFLSIVLLRTHLELAVWVLFLGAGLNQMTFACSNGMMAKSQHGEHLSRAAAWAQGGTLAAQALGGGALLYFSRRLPVPVLGALAAVLATIPALLALTIPEAPPQSGLHNLRSSCSRMLGEIKETLFSLKSLPGILLLLSPIGTGAAQNLFPALAAEYHVGEHGVVLLNGLLGGVLTMLGAFVAVVVPGHWDRRICYAASGLSASLIGIYLTFAPLVPAAYYAGVGLYLLTTGSCWGFFLGVVMVTLGEAGASASTRATILVCIGNLPIVYMTRAEAWAYGLFGIRGVPAIDAAGNLFVVVGVAIWLAARLRARPAAALAS
jgi:MFS transporter, PAT family, beta-lactamase induction signal transducer AmpG